MLRLALGVALVLSAAPLPAQEDVPEVARRVLQDANRQREDGRAEEAAKRYREVLEMAPSLLDAYVGLGAVYHQLDDYEAALATFASGLERYPDDGTLLFNAAATELKLERLDPALDYVERARAATPDDTDIHALRGSILRRLGRLEEAAEALETVAKLDPKSARAQFQLGNLYHELGRKEAALEAYERAVKIDGSYGPAHYNMGAVLFELGRFEEALKEYELALAPVEEDFEKGREVSPAHARAYLNLGAIYLERKSWDRALDAYEKAARLDPAQAAAHYNVGYTQYELGRMDEAYAAYEKAVAIDPSLPLSYLHLGLIDFDRGRLDRAAERLEAGVPALSGEDAVLAVRTLAEAYDGLGRVAEAESSYRKTLELAPGDVTALIGLGRVLRERGNVAEARAHLERASEVVLDSSGVAIELAALARAEGDRKRERALYEEALRRDGHRSEMWPVRVNLIAVLLRTGAFAEARAGLSELVPRLSGLSGLTPEIALRLRTAHALLLARDGDLAGSKRELDAVLSDAPTSLEALNARAALDAVSGDLEGAARGFQKVASTASGSALDALVRANLGVALWLSGQGESAREHLVAAAESFPENALLRGALGEIGLLRGEAPGAVRELRAAGVNCHGLARSVPAAAPASLLHLSLPELAESSAACERIRRALGLALVSAAAERYEDPASRREAREMLDEAVGLGVDGAARAQALFVRGTLALVAGDDGRARSDLEAALAGSLPVALVAPAHNNLGVALYRQGGSAEARRHFEQARAAAASLAPATLNLAIAHHDARDRERALRLYDEYVELGGARRGDATAWAESIRKIYR